MPVFNNILAGAAGQTGGAAAAGPIKSVRFNSDDSAYLNRTNSSAGSLTTWTWAAWVKLSEMNNTYPCLFSAGDSSDRFFVRYESGGTWEIFTDPPDGGLTERYSTNAVFRDFSGWAHYVLVWNTTSSTAAERVRFYVNGVEQTLDGTFSQNLQSSVNDSTEQLIGKEAGYSRYLDGYLADVYFIDGQALDPTSFGAFDDNGVWQAAAYSGTYGTNGYHLLDFANESGIGSDSSGNDNDFTVNNLIDDQITLPTWYTTTTLYTTSADVKANGTNRGQSAFTLSTAEFVYLIPEGGGTVGSVCHSSGSTYPSTFYTYVKDDDDSNWYYTGGFGTSETDDYVWDNTLTRDTFSFGAKKFSNKIDLYLIGDTRAGSPYQPTTDAKMSGSFPALINTDGATADADTDVLRDVPTNGSADDDTGAGGEVSGNYCTLNPLQNIANDTFSQGNLQVATNTSNYGTYTSTMATPLSGKWYAEVTIVSESGYTFVGLCSASSSPFTTTKSLYDHDSVAYYGRDGSRWIDGSSATYGATYTTGDIIGIAYDADAGSVAFYKNGSSQGTITSVPVREYFFAGSDFDGGSSCTYVWNFGQRAFAYSAPSGFKALCTTNLPTPTIADGSAYFDAKLYDGNGSTNAITGLDFSPDLVWLKSRGQAKSHSLFDTVRGVNKRLLPNTTDEEYTVANTLTSFDSNGFTLGSNNEANNSGYSHVAWAWDAGSSTASNTDGSITSSVRANQTAGFSIVSYTGSSTNTTVGHGLNAAPEMIIVKDRDYPYNWQVNHIGIGADESLIFNTTAAKADFNAWNNTRPTSSVFSLGAGTLGVNTNGNDLIAYCFAPVAGYSAFGKYIGNGSSDGPFVYTGFRPAFVMYKRTDSTSNWYVDDSKRLGYNFANKNLYPDDPGQESSGSFTDFLSNGFKLRAAGVRNTNSASYLFAAFAENPFQANGGLAR